MECVHGTPTELYSPHLLVFNWHLLYVTLIILSWQLFHRISNSQISQIAEVYSGATYGRLIVQFACLPCDRPTGQPQGRAHTEHGMATTIVLPTPFPLSQFKHIDRRTLKAAFRCTTSMNRKVRGKY